MTESDLLSLVENEEAQSIAASTSLLAEQRREALQYYYGEPYGNEVEGRSQVVTTEVKDAVEGIMPSLMAIFTSSDEVVRFEAQGPEDEEAAQQETDYVNYVYSRVNNGFTALYCLFKDALLLKNGYLKVYWEEYSDETKESYKGLNDIELAMLVQDPEIEVVSHREYEDPQYPGVKMHDATFRRVKNYGKVCIDPVPPEEVLISRDATNDLTKARFVEHKTLKSVSQIREMGYDVDDDIADSTSDDTPIERTQRLQFDQADTEEETAANDPSARRVWFREAYVKVDYDGDGIAELRKVSRVGKTILDNEEFDSLPIIGGTAIMMPHKHYGLSIHDLVKDIQLIKSTVVRQLLDNAYNQNNQQMEVLDGMVNMDDLLTSRPGGIKRVKAIGSIKPIQAPLLGAPFYQLLDYFDRMKVNRVGAMDFANQVDPDALNAKAHTAEIVRDAAAERINLMARILAETAVKDLFVKIRELCSKHQNKADVVKLRGKWVQVNPRDWRSKRDLTVTVGLGTGSQDLTLQGAMGIMQIQGQMVQLGLMGRTVAEVNIYKAANKYAKAVFPKDDGVYFQDPTGLPPPQPAPDPKIITAQIAAEAQKAIAGANLAAEQRVQAEKKAYDAQKTEFREMMAQASQAKEHQAQITQKLLELEDKSQERIQKVIADAHQQALDRQAEQLKLLVQGSIDERLQAQQAQAQKETAVAVAKAKPQQQPQK